MMDSHQLEDPDEIHRSQRRLSNRSARWVIVMIVLMMSVMAVVDQVFAPVGRSRPFVALALGGAGLLCYLILPSHQLRKWGSPLMVVSGVVIAGWGVYTYGSVRSTTTWGLFVAVVMAGTYLSLRAMWATASVSVIFLGGLTWAQANGHLVKAELLPDLRFWLMGCISSVVVGALLHHTRNATDQAHNLQLSQMEDRQRLEHERDQSQRRFKRIFRINPTALMIQFAGTRTVQEVNPAFERCFGFPGEDLVGQPADVLWADDSQWKAHCKRLFEQGRTGWQQANWRRPDGRVVEVLVSSELNEDSRGMMILTTVMDLSDALGASSPLNAGSGARS